MVITDGRVKALASLLWWIPLSCAANTQLRAEDDFFNLSLAELGQVQISIATGNSTSLDKAPATASVIYAAEIAAMGARTLNDVLETIPGLHVSLSALSRLDSVYSMRGIHTGFNSQVLLLLNGVAVQFSLQGGRPMQLRLPVIHIERIEVIRGPGSAIYGADAFAGVINVITRRAAAIEPHMGVGVGDFGGRELWLETAHNQSDWGLSLAMAYQESQDDPERLIPTDAQTGFDAGTGTRASHAPGPLNTRYRLLDTHLGFNSRHLQLNLWSWLARDAGIGAGAAQALDPAGHDDVDLMMFDASYHFNDEVDAWQNTLKVSHLRYQLHSYFALFPAGSVLPIDATGNLNLVPGAANWVAFSEGMIANLAGSTHDNQVEYVAQFSGWERHRLRIALGYKEQVLDARERKNYGPGVIDGSMAVVDGQLTDVSATPYVFIPDRQRQLHYVSLQDEWQLTQSLQLTGGLRFDDYSDFGGTSNPRLALVWSATDKLTSKLLYGSAFRPPAFAEQYFQNNPVSLGNPKLRPEQIDSIEWSLNYRVNSHWQSTLTLFDYQAKDMIEFVADARGSANKAQNVLDQDGRGLELELNWKPAANWLLSSNYSLQDARNSSTGQKIADAPRQQLMLSAMWEFTPRWSWYSQLNWVAERPRAYADTRAPIADYTLVNMTLRRHKLLPNVDLGLSLRNLADADAREPSGVLVASDYPLEGRSLWLHLNWIF